MLDTNGMNEVEEIKDRINIVDLVGQYVQLSRAGNNYKGVCPFHREKTPSFMVSSEKQIFKCFGCDAGGDIFEFIQRIENLTFPEALEMLASRAGVILPQQKKNPVQYKQEIDIKTKIYKINKLTSQVFNKIIIEHKVANEAKAYLQKRKIFDETIRQFMIGYAPKQRVLTDFLGKRGFNYIDLKNAGNPEKFYNRIIFPIFDVLDNVVGFTGRTLDDKVQPKYLNTPETPVFHKSKILYGLNFAKNHIKENDEVIVMEGQMDVILSHQSGVNNAVASSGTAITKEHLIILSRYTSNIVFCFDQDEAGYKAACKAITLAYELDISPYIISLPDGFKDAGEIVEKDANIWKETAKKTIPAMEWLIDKNLAKYLGKIGADDKKVIIKNLIGYLAIINNPLEKDRYLKLIAQKLMTSERIIEEILVRFKNKSSNNKQETDKEIDDKPKKLSTDELFIGLLFVYPEFIDVAKNNIKPEYLQKNSLQDVYKKLLECYNDDSFKKTLENTDNKVLLDNLEKKISKDLQEKVKFLIIQTENFIADADDEEIKNIFFDYLNTIKIRRNKEIKNNFAMQIAEAEKKKDHKLLKELIQKFQAEISKK